MKLGFHEVKCVGYEAGTNRNGHKVIDLTLMNREKETIQVQLYFVSPENIEISLRNMRQLGWSRDHVDGLDSIKSETARIEVYEEEYDGKMITKARFARGAVQNRWGKDAAQKFLADLARPKEHTSAFGGTPWGEE